MPQSTKSPESPSPEQVLEDIWLSFLPGAKIGVLGLNGAGKSSLLRIMAGDDRNFLGEAFPADGVSVGFLQQEPRLDPAKTVLGNVEEGVAPIRALLNRYDEVNARLGEDLSPAEMEKVLDEQARIQDKIEAANAWDLDSRLELAMDALRLPPADADVTTLSGGERRRVALCRLLLQSPDLLLLDEPTNHLDAESVGWLERFLKDYPGTVVAVTHDRYFLDNVAGWILELDRGARHPVGRATTRRGWSRNSSGSCWKRSRRPNGSGRSIASSNGSACRRARARPRARRASTRTKSCCARTRRRRIETAEIYIAPGPRLGDVVVEARHLRRATATTCSSRTSTSPCRAAASSASSGRTAPARPRCFG